MRFFDIKENGGRVVKGVNTTADVGVDAIKKQAAKFGNKVDKRVVGILVVPNNYAHGYECLSKNCTVLYHLDNSHYQTH